MKRSLEITGKRFKDVKLEGTFLKVLAEVGGAWIG